jgi:hypothetical protein
MKRIFIPTLGPRDWQRLLAQPELQWKPGRSAMSVAACWEEAATTLPPEILAALNASGARALANLQLLFAIPEWEVVLPGGATTSCTDVMALTSNAHGVAAIAVEAKVDEPFGPTLGEKRRQASAGQSERLDFLHAQLGLKKSLPDSVRYQLLHRAASAIITARHFHARTAVMIVQSFSPQAMWWEDFDRFGRALGATPQKGVVASVPGVSEPELFVGWCMGEQRFLQVDLRVGSELEPG